jgi:hypothetical protein
MHSMTFNAWFWLIISLYLTALVGLFGLGYYCGREDTTDPQNWHRVPEENPYREEVDDRFDRLMAAWLSEEEPVSPERIEQGAEPDDAITFGGLLAAPHQPRHERLASTGELRALAYAGDMDTINHQVAEFVAGLDTDEQ